MLPSAGVTRRHSGSLSLSAQAPGPAPVTGCRMGSRFGTGKHGLPAEQSSWRFGLRGGSLESLGKSWGAWGLSGLCLSYSNLTLISFLYLDLFLVFS